MTTNAMPVLWPLHHILPLAHTLMSTRRMQLKKRRFWRIKTHQDRSSFPRAYWTENSSNQYSSVEAVATGVGKINRTVLGYFILCYCSRSTGVGSTSLYVCMSYGTYILQCVCLESACNYGSNTSSRVGYSTFIKRCMESYLMFWRNRCYCFSNELWQQMRLPGTLIYRINTISNILSIWNWK